MLLQQFFTAGLGHASYLAGDEAAGEAVVIDPRRDVDVYLRPQAGQGLAIRHVLETHAQTTTSRAPGTSPPDRRHLLGQRGRGWGRAALRAPGPCRGGDEVQVGALPCGTWESPGHTPGTWPSWPFDGPAGGAAWRSSAGAPCWPAGRGALTWPGRGGAEVGAQTGKPGRAAGSWPRAQQESSAPAAGPAPAGAGLSHPRGGSLCAGGSNSPWSTVGRERRDERIARLALEGDAEAFAGRLLGDLPPLPAHWRRMHARNRRGPTPLAGLGPAPGLESLLPPLGISPEEVRSLVERGQAYVVDARGPEAFGGAHLPGSFGAGLGHTFGLWVGSVVPDDRPLILVLPGADDPLPGPLLAVWGEAVRQLLRAGYGRLAGYLAGGVRAWAAPRPAGQGPFPRSARASLGWPPRRGERGLLDVRQPAEWRRGPRPGRHLRPRGDPARAGRCPARPAVGRDLRHRLPLHRRRQRAAPRRHTGQHAVGRAARGQRPGGHRRLEGGRPAGDVRCGGAGCAATPRFAAAA